MHAIQSRAEIPSTHVSIKYCKEKYQAKYLLRGKKITIMNIYHFCIESVLLNIVNE